MVSRAPLDALTGAMRFNIPQEEATIGRGHPERLHKGGGVCMYGVWKLRSGGQKATAGEENILTVTSA